MQVKGPSSQKLEEPEKEDLALGKEVDEIEEEVRLLPEVIRNKKLSGARRRFKNQTGKA